LIAVPAIVAATTEVVAATTEVVAATTEVNAPAVPTLTTVAPSSDSMTATPMMTRESLRSRADATGEAQMSTYPAAWTTDVIDRRCPMMPSPRTGPPLPSRRSRGCGQGRLDPWRGVRSLSASICAIRGTGETAITPAAGAPMSEMKCRRRGTPGNDESGVGDDDS